MTNIRYAGMGWDASLKLVLRITASPPPCTASKTTDVKDRIKTDIQIQISTTTTLISSHRKDFGA